MVKHNIKLTSSPISVTLVPPSSAEDSDVAYMRSHPITRRYLRYIPRVLTTEQMAKRRLKFEDDANAFAFHIHDSTGSFAGTTGIHNIEWENDSFEVGIIVHPDFHKKGIATAALYALLKFAFEEKQLNRGIFLTGSDNVGMRRWLDSTAGATLECEMREAWKEGPGVYSNVVSYVILASEWRKIIKRLLEKKLGFA